MKIWTFFTKGEEVEHMDFLQGRKIQICGLSSERRNKSKIWTILEKEEQVKTMDPPGKWGVMMRLKSMMG